MGNEPNPLHPPTHLQMIPGPLWDEIKACLIELYTRDVLATKGATDSPWKRAVIEIARGIPDFAQTLASHPSPIIQQEQRKRAALERLKQIQARLRQGQEPTAEEIAFIEEQLASPPTDG
jgi:hypothetical protein